MRKDWPVNGSPEVIRTVIHGQKKELSGVPPQGEVKIVGRGASTDIIEASAKAYVDGLNKLARISAATA